MKALYEYASLEVISSVCESLEVPQYTHDIPGRSPEWQYFKAQAERQRRFLSKVLKRLGLEWRQQQRLKWEIEARFRRTIGMPIERAYDTIAIGRKIGTSF
jgi:hypothetical protein